MLENKFTQIFNFLVLIFFFSFPVGNIVAENSHSISANDVLEKVKNRDDGGNYFGEVTLITKKNSTEKIRKLVIMEKDYPPLEKSYMYFHDPSDVRGVGLQMVTYPEVDARESDQWIYLPAFRKTRRLAAADKRGSFMGTTYSYYDLDKIRLIDFTSSLLGEEKYQGRDCYVIERQAVSQAVMNKSGYQKAKIWVDKERHLILGQWLYDETGLKIKEYSVKKVEEVQGIWSIMESVMVDLKKDKESAFIFESLSYNISMSDHFFKKNQLKRKLSSSDWPIR